MKDKSNLLPFTLVKYTALYDKSATVVFDFYISIPNLKGANIDSSSSSSNNIPPRSNGLTSEEYGGRYCILSSLPISVANSQAGHDPLNLHA